MSCRRVQDYVSANLITGKRLFWTTLKPSKKKRTKTKSSNATKHCFIVASAGLNTDVSWMGRPASVDDVGEEARRFICNKKTHRCENAKVRCLETNKLRALLHGSMRIETSKRCQIWESTRRGRFWTCGVGHKRSKSVRN